MRKIFLLAVLLLSTQAAFCQFNIFMSMLENKMICNKEDQLTYYLQSNSFERHNENIYVHQYAEGGVFYHTNISNDNECYVIYRTNNIKDYNRIKKEITGMCPKELASDRSPCNVCNIKKIQDVQVIFSGYMLATDDYEIKVYQNPTEHQVPYAQSDRLPVGK